MYVWRTRKSVNRNNSYCSSWAAPKQSFLQTYLQIVIYCLLVASYYSYTIHTKGLQLYIRQLLLTRIRLLYANQSSPGLIYLNNWTTRESIWLHPSWFLSRMFPDRNPLHVGGMLNGVVFTHASGMAEGMAISSSRLQNVNNYWTHWH